MSVTEKLDRRWFLKAVTCLMGITCMSPLRVPAAVIKYNFSYDIARRLARTLAHKDSAEVIGIAYLRHVPEEADVGILIDRLFNADMHKIIKLLWMSDRKICEFISQRRQEDFENDNIFMLDGWLLSDTEVRLCALAVLVEI